MGSMNSNSPDCSVEVVDDTTMLFSWANAWELFIKIATKALINKFEISFFINIKK
jgi:hypothetical protein